MAFLALTPTGGWWRAGLDGVNYCILITYDG